MAGRPLKYETPTELQEAINEYFASNPDTPTVTGLAYELGFEDRSSIYDYAGREEFSYTIKKAILKIESKHEERLYEHSSSGSIFWLKNRGWGDGKDKDNGMEQYIKMLADALQPIPEAKESD